MSGLFNGRIGRTRYWRLTGFCLLAIMAATYAVVSTANQTSSAPVNIPATIVAIAGALSFVAACVAIFIVGVRRLHSRGKSGFRVILYYAVPSILALLAIDPEGKGTVAMRLALAIGVWQSSTSEYWTSRRNDQTSRRAAVRNDRRPRQGVGILFMAESSGLAGCEGSRACRENCRRAAARDRPVFPPSDSDRAVFSLKNDADHDSVGARAVDNRPISFRSQALSRSLTEVRHVLR